MSNTTAVPYVPCTLQTCPLSEGIIHYQPNIGGNALFAALFGIALIVQLVLGIQRKTWTFLFAMVCGLVLEIVGYVGRILLHDDPFNFNLFIMYLVCLTVAPAFLCAAIYVAFRRVVHSCGEEWSYVRPQRVSIIFMTADFLCLVLQAAGGAITSTSGGDSDQAETMRETGINIMIAGLALQVVSLSCFILYGSIYLWRCNAAEKVKTSLSKLESSLHSCQRLVLGLAIASFAILIRSAFRVAELRDGFESSLANNEVAFMILEGAMIVLACLALSVGHPALFVKMSWKIDKPWKSQAKVTSTNFNHKGHF